MPRLALRVPRSAWWRRGRTSRSYRQALLTNDWFLASQTRCVRRTCARRTMNATRSESVLANRLGSGKVLATLGTTKRPLLAERLKGPGWSRAKYLRRDHRFPAVVSSFLGHCPSQG